MRLNSVTQAVTSQATAGVLDQAANTTAAGKATAAREPWAAGATQLATANQSKILPGGCFNPFPSYIDSFVKMFQQLIKIIMQLLKGGAGNKAADADKGAGKAGGKDDAKGGGADPQMKNVGGRMAVPVDGPQGFLFKPASDSDGKLVVLVPKQCQGNVASVKVKDESGKVLSNGTLKGTFGDGRDIFRFDKAGASLPKNVTVEVTMKDGSVKKYPIGDPSKRYD